MVSEYDQGITQSQSADKPIAPRGKPVYLQRSTGSTQEDTSQYG